MSFVSIYVDGQFLCKTSRPDEFDIEYFKDRATLEDREDSGVVSGATTASDATADRLEYDAWKEGFGEQLSPASVFARLPGADRAPVVNSSDPGVGDALIFMLTSEGINVESSDWAGHVAAIESAGLISQATAEALTARSSPLPMALFTPLAWSAFGVIPASWDDGVSNPYVRGYDVSVDFGPNDASSRGIEVMADSAGVTNGVQHTLSFDYSLDATDGSNPVIQVALDHSGTIEVLGTVSAIDSYQFTFTSTQVMAGSKLRLSVEPGGSSNVNNRATFAALSLS